MLIRLIIGLLMTAVVLVFAAKRVLWLTNLIRSGQTTSDEHARKDHLGTRITTQIKEVFGQTRLLRWSIPGIAHFFTMWGFFILGIGLPRGVRRAVRPDFAIPFVGHWDALGFLQDFFAVAVLLGITTFAIIRIVREPKKHGRDSRFYGSHTGGAWLILFMIFNVIWTLRPVPRRGGGHRQPALRQRRVLLARHGLRCCTRSASTPTSGSRRSALLLHIGVMLVLPADRAALQAPAHRPGARST